jgi:hypothetical protein
VLVAGKLIKKEMAAKQATPFNQDMQSGSDAVKEGVVYKTIADSIMPPEA